MTKTTIVCTLLCAAVVGLVGRTASAAVCAEIDTSRDTLSEGDRNATRTLLTQALQREGFQVVPTGCVGTYSVYHVKLGNSITIFLQGPQGSAQFAPGPLGYRQATARALEEVPPVYSQMVRSLVTGQPMSNGNDTVDRTNATSAQQAPRRVEADSLWYARLGYGGVIGPDFSHGPAFGFGYRYELDSLGIDLSFFNFTVGSSVNDDNTSGSAGISGSWIKLMALYFLDPTANRSTYVGGGVGWGVTAVARADSATTTASAYAGSGLHAEASLGYELLRASTIRMFVQADATLPLYRVRSSTTTFDSVTGLSMTSSDASYAPSIAVSFGIGWGHGITRVAVIH